MRIATILGARPQFIKAAPVSARLRDDPAFEEILVHTGQHYDPAMSEVFFRQLGLPEPAYHLGVGSAPHGVQTGRMLERIEAVLMETRPDAVLVYGDTNSTLAGAVASCKLEVPLAHVEAGLRSFNRSMPEEHNRVLTDHASDLLFCPTETAREWLAREGIVKGVHVVGDVMYDAALEFAALAREKAPLEAKNLEPQGFVLATIHRPQNTDDGARLEAILDELEGLGEPVLLCLHPRTRARLADPDRPRGSLRLAEPVGYLEMLELLRNARAVVTDSGGIQKEAFFLETPCVTVRAETEWKETVELGWNALTGDDPRRIGELVRQASPGRRDRQPFGDGKAAGRIVDVLAGLA